MNLRNFKKVSDDPEKAIFKNDKGHSITVAKKSLKKDHLAQLESLPLHAAEGADIQQSTAGNVAQNPSPEPLQQQQAIEQDQEPQAIAQPQQPQNHEQNFNQEAAQYNQDLYNGHITPETYHDLFAKKETLGKIGTIFGLLVSGAGSGLSGQPNALLEMMNKEIDRDLQAQKTSKENALNFYRANIQNQINKSQIQRMGAETKGIDAETMIKGDTHAKNQMLLSALHSLQNDVNKLPPGSPQRVQAQNSLNGVSQAAVAEVQQNSAKGAQQLGVTQSGYEGMTNQMHVAGVMEPGLEGLAKQREEKELPGYGYSSVPLSEGRREQLNKILKYQQALDEYQHLANRVGLLGSFTKLDPKDKALAESIKSDLVSGYNDVKGLNRFTSNEEGLYNKVIPDFDKLEIKNMFGANKEVLSRLKDSVQRVKDIEFSSMTPFSDRKNKAESEGEEPKASAIEKKYYKGKWYTRGPNGESVEVK